MIPSLISELALLREAARRGTDNQSEQDAVIEALARDTRPTAKKEQTNERA